MITTLNLIPIKTQAAIVQIDAGYVTKERLESLGVIRGVKISFVRKSPLGATRVYKCLNTLIAMRNDVAEKIIVEVPDGIEEN